MTADRDLDAFVQAPVREGRRVRRIHPVRAVLTAAVVLGVAAVLVPTFDELAYSFRRDPPTDIGDATNLASGAALSEGSRVAAHVVLGNRAAEIPLWRKGSLRWGPIVVRQALGSPLWVEYETRLHPGWGAFVEADVDGRVVRFTGELDEARALVMRQGAEVPGDARVIIVDERPGEMSSYMVVWTLGLALAIWSVLGLLRHARPRVVVDGE